MTAGEDRKQDLQRRLARAKRYGQTAFVLLYEAQLRALNTTR